MYNECEFSFYGLVCEYIFYYLRDMHASRFTNKYIEHYISIEMKEGTLIN